MLLSVTRVWFPHVGPDDAATIKADNCPNCPIKESPNSLYNMIFTPPDLFVKSQCEKELDQNQNATMIFPRS